MSVARAIISRNKRVARILVARVFIIESNERDTLKDARVIGLKDARIALRLIAGESKSLVRYSNNI